MFRGRLILLPVFILLLANWPVFQATAQEPQQQDRTPIQIVTGIMAPYLIDNNKTPDIDQILMDKGAAVVAPIKPDRLRELNWHGGIAVASGI